jgi:hypothetical protein
VVVVVPTKEKLFFFGAEEGEEDATTATGVVLVVHARMIDLYIVSFFNEPWGKKNALERAEERHSFCETNAEESIKRKKKFAHRLWSRHTKVSPSSTIKYLRSFKFREHPPWESTTQS